VAWDDNRPSLAVFDALNAFSHNLQVFDVAEPANPVRIGKMTDSPGTGLSLKLRIDIVALGDYIYVAEIAHKRAGIHVLRLIDPDRRPDDTQAEASEN